MASTFNHFNAAEQVMFGSVITPLLAAGAILPGNLGTAASVVIQDITYTAVNGGVAGNSITVQYIEDGVAGVETVVVSGTSIVVHIGNHTVLGSTATQVRTALLLSPAAVLLVVPVISGTASNIQLAVAATPLVGGVTGATYLPLTGGTLTGPLGIGENPVASAELDVASITKGFLLPRMTTTQRLAISSPAEGLQVYDLTLHQLYMWNASSWVILG